MITIRDILQAVIGIALVILIPFLALIAMDKGNDKE